ncbi:MAG: DNA-binding protein [Candidatus Omnitrophota bacterium]
MKIPSISIIALVMMLWLPCKAAYGESGEARPVTSAELIEGANVIDGTVVAYKGEIVAAIMKRGDHAWANLKDGYNTIGVWCETASLGGVRTFGNYKNEGDILQVTGVFHRACPEHGGELDIHADTVRIEAPGFPIQELISMKRVDFAIAFFILALLSVFMLRKRL